MNEKNNMQEMQPLLLLQQGYAPSNALISIVLIITTNIIHTILLKHSKEYYGRSHAIDKLTVLLNLDFAALYSLVVGMWTL